MPTIAAGLAGLYYEVRDSGSPVLFIMGATGDAGHFTTVADLLPGWSGRELATEVAQACLRFAFEEVGSSAYSRARIHPTSSPRGSWRA